MQQQWRIFETGGFGLAPAVFGALLIAFGVLIIIRPELLAYLVAAIFILAGASMLAFAWSVRSRVTYRRFDESSDRMDPGPP